MIAFYVVFNIVTQQTLLTCLLLDDSILLSDLHSDEENLKNDNVS